MGTQESHLPIVFNPTSPSTHYLLKKKNSNKSRLKVGEGEPLKKEQHEALSQLSRPDVQRGRETLSSGARSAQLTRPPAGTFSRCTSGSGLAIGSESPRAQFPVLHFLSPLPGCLVLPAANSPSAPTPDPIYPSSPSSCMSVCPGELPIKHQLPLSLNPKFSPLPKIPPTPGRGLPDGGG